MTPDIILHEGDNLAVMAAMVPEWEGRIDLIYIDPPFATGRRFHALEGDTREFTEAAARLKQPVAYLDRFSREAYLDMLRPRLEAMRRLLAPRGSIYVHQGWQSVHAVKLLMDDAFGPENFQNQIIFHFGKFRAAKTRWKRDYESILFYSKSGSWLFNHDDVLDPYGPRTEERFDKVDDEGRVFKWVKDKKVYRAGGVTPSSVWRMSNMQANALESCGYETQKPLELLRRIVRASSPPGGVVADFFCGSGTTLVAARELGRRAIGCDTSPKAIALARERLGMMVVEPVRAFTP